MREWEFQKRKTSGNRMQREYAKDPVATVAMSASPFTSNVGRATSKRRKERRTLKNPVSLQREEIVSGENQSLVPACSVETNIPE